MVLDVAQLAAEREYWRIRARHYRALRERYPRTKDFLSAIDRFWGSGGYRTAADGTTHVAACPACRSKSMYSGKGWLRFPLVVGDPVADEEWSLFPSCGCSPQEIHEALLLDERDRLDAELASLTEAA